MNEDRNRILGRLRHALSRPDLKFPPTVAPALTTADRMPVTHLEGSSRELRFQEELQALHGTCEIADSDVTARIQAIRKVEEWCTLSADTPGQSEDAHRLLVWPELDSLLPGLLDGLQGRGYDPVIPADMAGTETRTACARIAIGITGADAAFATTGSILLKSGPQHSRVASLLPLRHLALIPTTVLWDNVEQWLAHEEQQGTLHHVLRNSANLTLVSGPSKSADIESQLTWGVHGPMNLHAILIPA